MKQSLSRHPPERSLCAQFESPCAVQLQRPHLPALLTRSSSHLRFRTGCVEMQNTATRQSTQENGCTQYICIDFEDLSREINSQEEWYIHLYCDRDEWTMCFDNWRWLGCMEADGGGVGESGSETGSYPHTSTHRLKGCWRSAVYSALESAIHRPY